ncbi:MAG: flavodoxin [Candidatus Lokiarchaeota archaeon]|nr:flavodoxin [Candidatus Lokiarchaeota archaeon]
MNKPIVIYFSRTGNTKKVAEIIASTLSCEQKPIIPLKSYKGFIGWWRAGFQAVREKLPAIEPINIDFKEYDLVIIGTPVWASKMSSPVRTFLTENLNNFKNVAFFNTSGGEEQENVLLDMSKLIHVEPKAILDLWEKDVKKGNINKKIEEFTEGLQ